MLAQLQAAVCFEREHDSTIRDFNFKWGDLVLVRNTAIEKALNRKMWARYIGPLIVISRNKGGAYIICELDGSVFDRPVATFRVIPYLARRSLAIPNLQDFIDVPRKRITEMEEGEIEDVEDSSEGPDSSENGENDLEDSATSAEEDWSLATPSNSESRNFSREEILIDFAR